MPEQPILRASAFIATSLDGFIAREDDALDWLHGAYHGDDDHGYAEFMRDIDVLVMGRGTYETVLGFDHWPFAGQRVVVLSRTGAAAIDDARVEVHPGPVPALCAHLEATGARHAYVDGGRVIQSFLEAGRLDAITITRIPVLIGRGKPLFGDAGRDVSLAHDRTVTYPSGFVQSRYVVRRDP